MVIGLQFLHSNSARSSVSKCLFVLGGHIKICDLGIAAEGIFHGKTTSRCAGYPGYRTPEIMINSYKGFSDEGASMYEMATGKLPFSPSGSNLMQFYTIKTTTPNYPQSLSQEMLDLLPKLSADNFIEISPGFSADSSRREKVEDLSYVDSSWNWQE
ncbi:hypothetical protein XELAEV_18012703mg [Xenopus laevis]|uniref:Protein kinase domain-containing protein n=1 Tax=Xenopus laevis TaxID=8355 RepID=A0A974DN57_XENLA|nr:hypothetical protein XELAEV_18012703mg [Xenopus laevis]